MIGPPYAPPPPGLTQAWWAPGFSDIIQLLRLIAGDPILAERAQLLIDATTVTDAAIVTIPETQDFARTYSTMVLRFTVASGNGRYDITGGNPTQTRGVQIPTGGGELTIRGAENIRRFRVIGEVGQVLNFSGFLFSSPLWNDVQQ